MFKKILIIVVVVAIISIGSFFTYKYYLKSKQPKQGMISNSESTQEQEEGIVVGKLEESDKQRQEYIQKNEIKSVENLLKESDILKKESSVTQKSIGELFQESDNIRESLK